MHSVNAHNVPISFARLFSSSISSHSLYYDISKKKIFKKFWFLRVVGEFLNWFDFLAQKEFNICGYDPYDSVEFSLLIAEELFISSNVSWIVTSFTSRYILVIDTIVNSYWDDVIVETVCKYERIDRMQSLSSHRFQSNRWGDRVEALRRFA